MPSDLHFLSLAEAARLIGSGELSPVELCEAYLERIGENNDALRAFLTVTDDAARRPERRSARRRARCALRVGAARMAVTPRRRLDTMLPELF